MRYFIAGLFLLTAACKPRPATQFPVLEEKKVSVRSSDYTERSNLIEQMWVEVRKKTDAARDIEIESKDWEKLLRDSLESWNHFIQKNQEYYSLVPVYLGKIHDSTLRRYWTRYFDSAQASFKNAVDSLQALASLLTQQQIDLNDVIVQMKLKFTHNMLHDYQEQQMPDKKPLERIAVLQDSILTYYRELLRDTPVTTQPVQ